MIKGRPKKYDKNRITWDSLDIAESLSSDTDLKFQKIIVNKMSKLSLTITGRNFDIRVRQINYGRS